MKNKKKQKNNGWSIAAFIISIAAFVISIVALCFSLVRVIDTYYLSDSSYISIIVTLMGICATFIVCYQIYNGIEMSRRIAKVERLEERLPNWETLKFESEGNLELSKGFLYQSLQSYNLSFFCYQSALYNYITANIDDKIDDVLTNMEDCLKNIHIANHSQEMVSFEKLSDKIEALDTFKEYERRYNDIKRKINNESKKTN